MSKKNIHAQTTKLLPIVDKLKKTTDLKEKILILSELHWVKEVLDSKKFKFVFFRDFNLTEELAIKAIFAIDQAPVIFNLKHMPEDQNEHLDRLIEHLVEIENFYGQLGGIIGYHLTFLTLILEQEIPDYSQNIHYIPPVGIHVDQDNPEIRHHIKIGISHLSQTAVFIPIGGAGDRLNLLHEVNNRPLPAAILPFLGRTLLEGLIRDLQALEYLFYKLFGQRIFIPLVLMTSNEKDNHKHVRDIIEDHGLFGRPQASFHFVLQPLVPLITEEGNWSLTSPLTLSLKPGGHGIIWKLAEDSGLFTLLAEQGYHQAFVRQINNPLAGTDIGLLALIGLGSRAHKSFGFLSCERFLHSAEGANVLIEKNEGDTYSYCISNIEYTDFDRKTIGEIPLSENSPFSKFPSNTNILYVNFDAVRTALKKCSIPGTLINMKTVVPFIDSEGHKSEIKGGRLESTMQNIADYMSDEFPHPLKENEFSKSLQTFILFNERIKTISTTKKSFKTGESPLGTPEQAYYDLIHNNLKLFEEGCLFSVPQLRDFDAYIDKGPNCLIIFHPGLGPLYSVIAQKIRKGRLAENAELQIEMSEVDIQNLDLEGSLIIEASDPLALMPANNNFCGNCTLKNIKIRNKGIDRQSTHHYWKNRITRHEAIKIILGEGAEFHAENISLEGNQVFEVPSFHRLTLTCNSEGEPVHELRKISSGTWHWDYLFDENNHIRLLKKPVTSTSSSSKRKEEG